MDVLRTVTRYIPTSALVAIPVQVFLSTIDEIPTVPLLVIYIITNASLLAYQLTTGPQSAALISTALGLVGENAAFLVTATALTVVRRLYFHPLSKFPGPKRYAISKLWEGYSNCLGEHATRVRDLHRHYKSPIVRIGPNEVSVSSVDAIVPLYSRGLPHRTRGPVYELWKFQGDVSLITTRDNNVHRLWRGLWDRAFANRSMEYYAKRVEEHVQRLVDVTGMAAKNNGKVNMTKVFENFTFDVMADLGFGQENYGLQTGEGDSAYADTIHEYMCSINVVSTFRNLLDITPYLPLERVPRIKEFRNYGYKLLEQRLAMEKPPPDVASVFLEKDPVTGAKFTATQVKTNVELLVLAGSDTTTSVLTSLIYMLTRHPNVQSRLHSEIDTLVASGGVINATSTAKLPFLNAVINETMRLWPAVPSGSQAMTGPEGLEIEGVKIPGKTTARVFQMVLHTDERYFAKPDEFIPERFLNEKPDLIKDRRAFIPFSYGQHSCVGKGLALQELRLSISRLVYKYRFTSGPNASSPEKYRKEWKDYMVAKCGPCWVTVEERQ